MPAPAIRIERVPVQAFGLGILGFDHLQLVFQPPGHSAAVQASWLVIEGLRENGPEGTRLAVEGWHGATTLADANGGATGEELVSKIGTDVQRGSREIISGARAYETWATFVSLATDIELERFPYVAFALPGSPLPTINSSSLVASLLYHAGIEFGAVAPFGLRWAPGTTTLLGSSRDEKLDLAESNFTAVLAGKGNDSLFGSGDAHRVDKLYGGPGSDVLRWSKGYNVLHGGQPGLAYVADGSDTVDYSGAGRIQIEAGARPLEHARPDYVATFSRGIDHLFSIEELIWDDASDTVVLGRGIGLLRDPLKLGLGGGDDMLDAGCGEFAVSIDAGPGQDVVIAGPAVIAVRGGDGADRFVIAGARGDLALLDVDADDRVLVPWEFAEARAETGEGGELVIQIRHEHLGSAHLRVFGFKRGDLGLELDGALSVRLDVNRARELVLPDNPDPFTDMENGGEPFSNLSLDDLRHG